MNAGKRDWIALLRAIGPATHKLMSMSRLRDACSAAGLESVQTVLATGNLLFRSDCPEPTLQDMLTDILARHGLDNDVFLRRPKELRNILMANPLPESAEQRPNHMLVLFMESAPGADEIEALAGHGGPEETACIGREAYIDFVDGVGRSRLTPVRLEKLLGRRGTARNWNTIQKLVERGGD